MINFSLRSKFFSTLLINSLINQLSDISFLLRLEDSKLRTSHSRRSLRLKRIFSNRSFICIDRVDVPFTFKYKHVIILRISLYWCWRNLAAFKSWVMKSITKSCALITSQRLSKYISECRPWLRSRGNICETFTKLLFYFLTPLLYWTTLAYSVEIFVLKIPFKLWTFLFKIFEVNGSCEFEIRRLL